MSQPDLKTATSFSLYRMWTSILVLGVFMLIDFLWYGWIASNGPYFDDVAGKLIWSAVLAFTFSALYNQACTWHPHEGKGFKGYKYGYSLVFSAFFAAALIAAIALSGYLVSVTFMYVLDAFRGIPESGTDVCVLCVKIIVGGVVLEVCGQDETEERRNG